MKYCPLCDQQYDDSAEICEVDGAVLQEVRPRQDTLTGKIIKGRYRVLKKLGDGGMGTVYLAEQVAISRNVALKVLHTDYARDQEFVRRFRQEARLAASLNHRNVITVFDFDQTDDGSLYIVMEFVDGSNLARVIQEGPMAVPRAIRLAAQIADGLEAAHRAGVIHRDVKPENIMIVGADEIKLMDFGIARLRDTGTASRLTRSGTIMGTPAYMAPEQIEGGDVSERTDIYAFGIVLYEMLSGVAPFRAPTPAAVLLKHLQEAPTPLRKLRREIPAALEHIVSQALEKNPEKRQHDFRSVIEALRNLQLEVRQNGTFLALAVTRPLAKAREAFSAISAQVWRVIDGALQSAKTYFTRWVGVGTKTSDEAEGGRIDETEFISQKSKPTTAAAAEIPAHSQTADSIESALSTEPHLSVDKLGVAEPVIERHVTAQKAVQGRSSIATGSTSLPASLAAPATVISESLPIPVETVSTKDFSETSKQIDLEHASEIVPKSDLPANEWRTEAKTSASAEPTVIEADQNTSSALAVEDRSLRARDASPSGAAMTVADPATLTQPSRSAAVPTAELKRPGASQNASTERAIDIARTTVLPDDAMIGETVDSIFEVGISRDQPTDSALQLRTEISVERPADLQQEIVQVNKQLSSSSGTLVSAEKHNEIRAANSVLGQPVNPTELVSVGLSETKTLSHEGNRADTIISTRQIVAPKPRGDNWRWIVAGASAAAVLALMGPALYRGIIKEPPVELSKVAQRPSSVPVLPKPVNRPPEDLPESENGAPEVKPTQGSTNQTSIETTSQKPVIPPTEGKQPLKTSEKSTSTKPGQPNAPTKNPSAPNQKSGKDTEVDVVKMEVKDRPIISEPTKPTKRPESPSKDPSTEVANLPTRPIDQPLPTSPVVPRLLSLEVQPSRRQLSVSERLMLTVKGKYSDGKVNEVGGAVRWNSSDPSVVRVNSRGEIEALREGRAQITAKYESVTSPEYDFRVTGGTTNKTVEKQQEEIKDIIRRGPLR